MDANTPEHDLTLYTGDGGLARARLITRLTAELADRSPNSSANDLPAAAQMPQLSQDIKKYLYHISLLIRCMQVMLGLPEQGWSQGWQQSWQIVHLRP